ncbi:hypothetical protein [Prochlorococcus sp. MIT 1223]|uniref:hypothetical protein n=1 Tax=Prochlorococcus sp. MIT 1223 TaxID=3096217 RepID=UPI002A7572BD|nr:hypothetical protein [Prochlorococcus sp. MIT 1223]
MKKSRTILKNEISSAVNTSFAPVFMFIQTFAALASFNQSAALVGVLSMVLFAIVGVVVGPDYDGMNAPAVKKD